MAASASTTKAGRGKSNAGGASLGLTFTGGKAPPVHSTDLEEDEALRIITESADAAEVPDDERPLSSARSRAMGRAHGGMRDLAAAYASVPDLIQEESQAAVDGGNPQACEGGLAEFDKDAGLAADAEALDLADSGPVRKTVHQATMRGKSDMSMSEGATRDPKLRGYQMLMDDPRLLANEAARKVYLHVMKASNEGKLQKRVVQGRWVSPISKNYNIVKDHVELEDGNEGDNIGAAHTGPATHLSEWFDAGLHKLAGSEGLEGNRDLPTGYEMAPWSSQAVPLIRHRKTGVVIWPVRMDLMPLFGGSEQEAQQKPNSKLKRNTVYHYTSTGGFRRIVAPPTSVTDDNSGDEELFAEEVWNRIDDDLHHHGVPRPEGAQEMALQFVGSEPGKFPNAETIARTVLCTTRARAPPGKFGHCIALQVPSNFCRTLTGKLYLNTVMLLPPTHVEEEEAEAAHLGGLVGWSHGAANAQKQQASTAAEIKSHNFLDGIIDRTTGNPVDPADLAGTPTSRAVRPASPGSPGSPGSAGSGGKAQPQEGGEGEKGGEEGDDDEEVAKLRSRLLQLQKDQQLLQKKISHSMRAQAKLDEGREVKFLATDEHRMQSLHKRLARCTMQLQTVERELELVLDGSDSEDEHGVKGPEKSSSEEEEEQTGGMFDLEEEGDPALADADPAVGEALTETPTGKKTGSRKLAALRRRRRRQKTQGGDTYFACEIKETIQEVGDEYEMQAGEVFREVFGGNILGARAWLQTKESEINVLHPRIGWAPLHMAVSMGDPRMVSLLLNHTADVSMATQDYGWSAVHFAVWKSTTELLRMLLKADDGSVKYKTKEGETALYMSITSSSPRVRDEMVRELLKAHADPNAKNDQEWTPLALAVSKNYPAEVRQMIQNRGNIFDESPDEPGKTIWQASAKHPGLQDLIRSKLNSRDLHVVEKRWPGTLTGKKNRG